MQRYFRCHDERVILQMLTCRSTPAFPGVAENILLGQLAPLGTGEFELLLDEESLKRAPVVSGSVAGIAADRNAYLGAMTPGAATPFIGGEKTPWHHMQSPGPLEASYSPQIESGSFSPIGAAYAPKSPGYPLQSPGYAPQSPGYTPQSPGYAIQSPGYR